MEGIWGNFLILLGSIKIHISDHSYKAPKSILTFRYIGFVLFALKVPSERFKMGYNNAPEIPAHPLGYLPVFAYI